jgi:hypothetical protein
MPQARIEPPALPKKGKGAPPILASQNLEKTADGQLVPLNFAVSAAFKREFKIFAAERDMSMVELLHACFTAYREEKMHEMTK